MENLRTFYQFKPQYLYQNHGYISFIKISFDQNQERIVAYDIKGISYLIEFITDEWITRRLGFIGYPTVVSFNPFKNSEIIAGFNSGKLKIFTFYHDLECLYVIQCHQLPPQWISFNKSFILTSSKREVIIWDILSFSQINCFRMKNRNVHIKKTIYSYPSSIIILYENNVVESWQSGNYNLEIKIYLENYGLKMIKDFISTNNGKTVIFYSAEKIVMFDTMSWSLKKSFILYHSSNGIKTLGVLPFLLNYQYKTVIIIIFNNGKSILFDGFSMHFIKSINHAFTNIRDIIISDHNQWVAWIQYDGTLNISSYYQLMERKKFYLTTVTDFKSEFHFIDQHYQYIQNNIIAVLKYSTLESILEKFNEFPKHYRDIIWITLMKLPGNRKAFSVLCSTIFNKAISQRVKNVQLWNQNNRTSFILLFECLNKAFPCFDQTLLFAKVVNLFVIIFKNHLLYAFEAILTVLLNFCQKWFEYYPFPPLNILNMIENMLIEVDLDLIKFYYKKEITSLHYAWPLLKTLMSNVLAETEWFILWDHLLFYRDSCLLLMCVAAFNIYQRKTILSLQEKDKIENFFIKPNDIKAKQLITLSISLHSKLSFKNHPHQYLRHEFLKLSDEESYNEILYDEYPKFLIENSKTSSQLFDESNGNIKLNKKS